MQDSLERVKNNTLEYDLHDIRLIKVENNLVFSSMLKTFQRYATKIVPKNRLNIKCLALNQIILKKSPKIIFKYQKQNMNVTEKISTKEKEQ